MVDVKTAEDIICSAELRLPVVSVPVDQAEGRILREDLTADEDFPPFHRVMMDGIAIRMEDLERGTRQFRITGVQAAGKPQISLETPDQCLEVMTGSMLPEGTDTVIPYEQIHIDRDKNIAILGDIQTKRGKNVHPKGTDKKKGDILVKSGFRISGPEIGLAASVGKKELKVTRNPRVAIVSTGDELVDIDVKPQPYQIRRSNVYAIRADLSGLGIGSSIYHLADKKVHLAEALGPILEAHDVLILSGGVSKGRFDFVPEILEELGVENLFHRVNQKPGKPFWFGRRQDEKVVFAFPGNPVSTFLCFHRYFVPWLRKTLGLRVKKEIRAALTEDFTFDSDRTYFLQVRTFYDSDGRLWAEPHMGRGSGDHANLNISDGFLELPGGINFFRKGEVFRLYPFR